MLNELYKEVILAAVETHCGQCFCCLQAALRPAIFQTQGFALFGFCDMIGGTVTALMNKEENYEKMELDWDDNYRCAFDRMCQDRQEKSV
jgi:hypothetical protein